MQPSRTPALEEKGRGRGRGEENERNGVCSYADVKAWDIEAEGVETRGVKVGELKVEYVYTQYVTLEEDVTAWDIRAENINVEASLDYSFFELFAICYLSTSKKSNACIHPS